MHTARHTLRAAVIDEKIYAVGGNGGLRKLEVYDPATDTWTEKADMATPRAWFGLSVVDGKLYATGGANSLRGTRSSSVEAYDPATDTWTQIGDMPVATYFHASCTVDGKIYVIGGYPTNDNPSSTVYEFDPIADTWTRKADMPTARGVPGVAVVDGRIYVTGGINSGSSALSRVEMYDPAKDEWMQKARMPRGSTASVSALDGKIYAFGGVLAKGGTGQRSMYRYDTGTDAWEQISGMPVNNTGLATVSLNGSIYLIGGCSGPYPYTSGILKSVRQFTPTPPVDAWPELISLGIAGFEPEGIELGSGQDFFVGAFSYSTWFGEPFSPQSGAIYKGNLSTGEGELLVDPTGTPVKGLSYDARTDYLWVAKGMGSSGQGVVVYDATSGEEIANITYEGERTNNDILVTENAVYCTDSYSPVLYRIPLGTGGQLPDPLVVEDFAMDGFAMHPEAGKANANGLVETPDGNLIVINIATGVLYHVDTTSGDAEAVDVGGSEHFFPNGDGLYLDGNMLYICQNFSNKIGVVQMSEDFKSGVFMWNLVGESLSVPTTITGYGSFIYAINTNFPQISGGNHAESIPAVVKLPNVGIPSVRVAGLSMEGADSLRIRCATPAPSTLFEVVLDQAAGLAGPWTEASTEFQEGEGGGSFLIPFEPGEKQSFYRVVLKGR